MEQQNSLSTEKVNISTQKLLGGIGCVSMLLGSIPGIIGNILSLLGIIFWLISLYQISKKIKKPEIFDKIMKGFILGILGFIIAFIFWSISYISFYSRSIRGEEGLSFGMYVGLFIAILIVYVSFIAYSYFQKEAYKILALATNHNLFNTAGLFIYIGAITSILIIGLVIAFIGMIILTVAFFTAPDEIEIENE